MSKAVLTPCGKNANSLTVPYSVVVIKPFSIGRGDGPAILEDLLRSAPISLRMFRSWVICSTTLHALTDNSAENYNAEVVHVARKIPSWVCLFTHVDRVTDPTDLIMDVCGPPDPLKWLPEHLRMKYSGYHKLGFAMHPSDTVVHISDFSRRGLEASLLLTNFDAYKF